MFVSRQVAALLTLSLAAVSRAAPAVDDAFYVDPMYQPYLTSLPMYPAVYLPAHPYLRTPYSNAPAYYPSPALNRFNANARLFGLSALLNLIDLKPLLPMMFVSSISSFLSSVRDRPKSVTHTRLEIQIQ